MFIRPSLKARSAILRTSLSINWRSFHGTPIPRGACPDSRRPARNLREQRRNEPAHPLRSRPSSVAGPAAGSKRQRPDNRGHLRASAQQPSRVVEEFRAASEVSAATRSRPLHPEAGCCRAQEKRRAVPAHVVGCSLGRSESPRCKVLTRQLDSNVARRRHHVRLHVLARGASSRSDFDAGPPARLPRPPQNSRRLALGEALETSRPCHAPALSSGRNLQVCKMSDASQPHPKGDCTVHGCLLKVVHHERRLFRSVDIESRARSSDLDFHLRPLAWDQIGIGFILSWSVRPEFFPPESGYGDVLHRMVSLQLVLGSPVLRSQVDALEMGPVRSDAKRNTDKTPQVRWRVGRSVTTQVHFNCAILKGASWNDGETAGIIQTLWTGIANTHGATA